MSRGWEIDQHLYVMQRSDGCVKIGASADPERRRKSLLNLKKEYPALIWVSLIKRRDAGIIESDAHFTLRLARVHWEWFLIEPEMAIHTVENSMNKRDRGEINRLWRPPTRGPQSDPAGGWTLDQVRQRLAENGWSQWLPANG